MPDNRPLLTLRPSLRLYPTPTGVVFFDRDPYNVEAQYVIKPKVAVVLALFDGQHDIKQVAHIASRIFDSSPNSMEVDITRIVDDVRGTLLIDASCANQRWTALCPTVTSHRDLLYRLEKPLEFGRAAFPYSLVYIVTNRCYRRCVYCYADAAPTSQDGSILSMRRLEELFVEMEQLGTSMVNFTGGDPFVRKDMPDIAVLAMEHGIFPWISTKAKVPLQVAQQLATAGLPVVQISIDAHDSSICDNLCGVRGSYEEICYTLEAFLSAGVPVYTNTVITAANIEHAPTLVEWLLSLGVQMCILTPYARSLGRHSDALFATRSQWASFLRWYEGTGSDRSKVQLRYAQGLQDYLGVTVGNDLEKKEGMASVSHNACTAGRQGFAILPDGKVVLCERLAYLSPISSVGDLKEQSIKDVWNSEEMLSMVYPPRALFTGIVCGECDEFDACSRKGGRCYVRSQLAYGKLFAPDPLCPRAPVTEKRVI